MGEKYNQAFEMWVQLPETVVGDKVVPPRKIEIAYDDSQITAPSTEWKTTYIGHDASVQNR